jgi:hypothetical protein
MNNVLDLTGHFLYIALRIVLLPVFVALDIFLGAWLTAKFIRKGAGILYIKAKKKHLVPQPAFKKGLIVLRAKLIGVPANGH